MIIVVDADGSRVIAADSLIFGESNVQDLGNGEYLVGAATQQVLRTATAERTLYVTSDRAVSRGVTRSGQATKYATESRTRESTRVVEDATYLTRYKPQTAWFTPTPLRYATVEKDVTGTVVHTGDSFTVTKPVTCTEYVTRDVTVTEGTTY